MGVLWLVMLSCSAFVGCEQGGGLMDTHWQPPPAPAGMIPHVERRNSYVLPGSTRDQAGQSMKITGLSGMTYLGPEIDGETVAPLAFEEAWHRFAAVADRNHAILVLMRVRFRAEGSIADVDVTGCTRLAHRLDFEGIAASGPGTSIDGETAWVWLSDEHRRQPGIHRYDLASGSRLQTYAMPDVLRERRRLPGSAKAAYPVRSNMGLESLTVSPEGHELWTATEQALTHDGPTATDKQGTIVRLIRFARHGNHDLVPIGQYAYPVDPIHATRTPRAVSGLVELMMTPQGQLLALERSAIESLSPFQHRLYLVDFDQADDISDITTGLADPDARAYRPLNKQLIWKTSWLTSPGNMEGLALGPTLPNGHHVLLGVVDDGDPISGNLILSFELSQQPADAEMAQK